MSSAFSKEVRRSITSSWGRFLAIAGIVALGCGFYAGLRMTGPDMRINADAFYDGTELYDLRVLSTQGLTDSAVDLISNTEGVDEVMPVKSTDVVATLNGEQYVVRTTSLDVEGAEESTAVNAYTVDSDDSSYLNRLVLDEGSWPTQEGECVLSADRVMGTSIQIGDTVEVLYGASDLDGTLDTRTYTVVGLVSSSAYVSSVSMGTTTLGSGTIQQYMFVAPENFSEDCPYTEVNIKVAGASNEFAGSDEYKAAVAEVADRLTAESDEIASARLQEVKASAQDELDTEVANLATRKQDAYSQLADAKTQLDEAAATLESSQQQIDDAQASYDSGLAQVNDAQAQIDAGWDAYNQGLDEWRTQSDAWNGTTRPGLQANLQQVTAGMGQVNQGIAGVQAQIAALDPADPNYQTQYDALMAQLSQLQEQLAQLTSQQAQLEAGILQGDQQVSDAKATLDATVQTLNDSQAQVDSSRMQLDSAAVSLVNAREQLVQGQQEYADGLASYQSNLAEADSGFADAQAQIDDAQAAIDDLEAPSIYVLDRDQNYGVRSFASDASRIDNIAAVFPFIFFLVAALVALTTMTRMVDEERVLIGTYKALGYSRARITSKYLIYAGVASTVGSVVGILLLSQVLPAVICLAYAIIYNVPQQAFPLTIDMPLALLSAGLGIGITLVATWAAATATLREEPATLMLPRAPKAGKRILLERMKPLWKRLSFSWKVTFRNMFRYRKRLWMTIIGIAGCTALLLTGLGLHDAIWDIIDNQFEEIVHYNVIVGLKDDTTEDDVYDVDSYLASEGDATESTRAEQVNMQVSSSTHDALGIQVVVPQDTEAMAQMVTMQTRLGKKPVNLDDNSVIITEKMATTLDVAVGDTVTFYDQDEVGNATGDGYSLTITGITENYVGDYAYIGSEAYANATGAGLSYNSIYAVVTDDTTQREALTDGLHDIDAVDTVTYNDETIDSYRSMLSSVNMIVVVLVVAAAALAFIVLYNLTNINITERRREIASLKVLGFTPREVDAYIYREIALLSVLGALFGLVLGVFLESFVVVTAEVDQVMFGRIIHPLSFLWAFLITLLFTLLVMIFMRRKLNDVNMVESLKSVD